MDVNICPNDRMNRIGNPGRVTVMDVEPLIGPFQIRQDDVIHVRIRKQFTQNRLNVYDVASGFLEEYVLSQDMSLVNQDPPPCASGLL